MQRTRGRHVEDVSCDANREDPAETLVEDPLNEKAEHDYLLKLLHDERALGHVIGLRSGVLARLPKHILHGETKRPPDCCAPAPTFTARSNMPLRFQAGGGSGTEVADACSEVNQAEEEGFCHSEEAHWFHSSSVEGTPR